MINYIFRKPKYPVVYENNNNLIGGKNEKFFERKIEKLNISSKAPHNVIDATGEIWFLSTNTDLTMSPLSSRKRCTKKKLIEIYNSSNNSKENKNQYSEKSLSAKKFTRIIGDIVDLLES